MNLNDKNLETTGSSKWLLMEQPRLRTGGFMVLLILTNVLVPFSLDIYTPAIPELPHYFQTSEALVNFTILGFYVFFSLGLLIFGPLSDRFGRRPILILGFVLYTVGSGLCPLSPSIFILIFARIVEALGAGAVSAISTALLKDCFIPEKRGTILAIIQVFTVIGPVFAPLLGGVILLFAPWQAIFWFLTIVGALFLGASLLFAETLPPEKRLQTNFSKSFNGLVRVMRKKTFMVLLLAASCCAIPMMAYVEVGSYIYVDIFGQTPQVYTYFFAASAGISVLGPILFLRFGKHVSPWRLPFFLLGACAVVGLVILTFGSQSIWVFAICSVIIAATAATLRPLATDILLEMTHDDIGSASSVINFVMNALGVIGMILIMLPFTNYVVGVGVLLLISMIVALVLWFIVCRRVTTTKSRSR